MPLLGRQFAKCVRVFSMETNKVLKWTVVLGIFLVPFVPFFVADTMFFPFITGKNFAFRILVEILLALWIILAVRDKKYRPDFKHPLFICYGALTVILILADFFGANPYRSFWSNYERMEGLITHLHLFAYFLVAAMVLSSQRLWERFFQASIVASVIMAFYGFLQLGGKIGIDQSATRLDGTLGNSAYLAIYMLFHIFLSLYFLFRNIKKRGSGWVSFVYAIPIVLDTIILYYTATRGSMLGLIGGIILALLLIAVFEKEQVTLRKISIGVIVAIILLIGGFLAIRKTAFVQNSPVLSRFASISATDSTTKSRFMVWNMALQGFKERPLLGWGQENFGIVFAKYYNPGMYAQEPWFDRTHDVFLDWLIDAGALGLLAYLSLFGVSLYLIWRKIPSFGVVDKSIFTGMFAGYFIHNLFVFDNLTSYVLFFSVLAFLYAISVEPSADTVPNSSEAATIGVSVTVLVALVFGIYYLNIKPINASLTLIEALQNQNNPIQSEALFKQSLSYDTFGKGETREFLLSNASQVVSNTAFTSPQKQEFLTFTKDEMDKQIAENPKDARDLSIMVSLLNQLRLYQVALPYATKVVELAPKKQQILLEFSDTLAGLGQFDKALGVAKEAYELDTSFDEVKFHYVAVAILAHHEEILKTLFDLGDIKYLKDGQVINAYLTTEQFEKAIKGVEMLILENPNNLGLYVTAARIYQKENKNTEAVDAIKRAEAANPQFSGQGEGLIQQIQAGKQI